MSRLEESTMSHCCSPQLQPLLLKALSQMTEALGILDDLDAPGDIGSHLDLAISRLERQLGLENHLAASIGTLVTRLAEDRSAVEAGSGELSSPWDAAPI
jgi:hypothetical protein